MATALDVAFVFLAAAPPEDFLTGLKLQKLCSYAQAVSLAYTGNRYSRKTSRLGHMAQLFRRCTRGLRATALNLLRRPTHGKPPAKS